MVFIGYFMGATVIIGFAAISLLSGQAEYVDESGRIAGGANMIAVHLSRLVGGDAFVGFISAVAFATILAVVSGILLSASAGVAHDLYTRVIRRGDISDSAEIKVSRLATVVIGATAIALSLLFKDMNVGVISTFVLAIAASVNFPVIILALFWAGLTTRGAVAGGSAGLIVVTLLSLLSPTIWVDILGNAEPIYPYAYPTLFSVIAAFVTAIVVSRSDGSERALVDRDAYPDQLLPSSLRRS